MDCRTVFLFSVVVLVAVLLSGAEGRKKKVVIHVPYKVKKIKHTHTVYKTIHHHHTHHDHVDPLLALSPTEEHEHFHHVHLHDEGQHSQPVPGIGIPEFLPDVPLDAPDEHDLPLIPNRHMIPLYRRKIRKVGYTSKKEETEDERSSHT